jgi:hypothetical protein
MSIAVNEKGIVYLNSRTMNAIFDCVYGIQDGLHPNTRALLKEEMLSDLVKLLNQIQGFNYNYRQNQACELLSIFEYTVGPMQSNSDGPIIWCALGLAIKELYGLKRDTLTELLKLVKVRK